MSLSSGTRLGPYEIVTPLGAGGMGEVYRARDTNLDRDVALKILPESFASDPDRLMRFEREAKTLASLNHPHIAAIYGLEGEKTPDGLSRPTRALVMELVEGEDLSEHIARGALPVDEALAIARQIIDALEAAHEVGIVHRDLKPANIKVREDGTVKVLDFGLAKAVDAAGGFGTQDSGLRTQDPGPTMTSPAMTQMGMIIGTAAYMSPEQARGRAVDKRTDVWAFGCVLFEMLTGRKAFDGEDVTETISAVMKTEPDWSALPAGLPAAVRTVVTRCLMKDRKARIPDLSVVRYLLDGTVAGEGGMDDAAPTPQRSVRLWQAASAVFVVTTVVAGAAWYGARTAGQAEPADVIQFTLAPQGEGGLWLSRGQTNRVAISPDGRLVVYQGRRGDEPVLVIRRLEETEGVVLRGAEGGIEPFFSPGSDFVGFVDADSRVVKKVSINGGTAKEIVRLDGSATRIVGATWTDDDQVIVGVLPRAGLFSVSADGGSLVKFSDLDADMNLCWPSAIPGTRAVLFVSAPGAPGLTGQLMVLNRDTGVATSLAIAGTSPVYLPSGHLLYATWDGEVMAVPFDLGRLAVTGTPVSVLASVERSSSGAADFSVSRQGRLVYIAGQAVSTAGELVWVAPDGAEEPIAAPVREYRSVRISPDGTQLLVDIADASPAQRDPDFSLSRIWLWGLTRSSLLRPWTVDTTASERPVWSPDGTRVVYSDGRNLFARLADGTGDAKPLTHATEGQRSPNAISPDGGVLFSYSLSAGTQQDVRMVSLDGDQAVTPLVQTDASEFAATLSPDGRWMAYVMGLGSARAIYVRPFRDAGGAPIPISAGGGAAPVWSPDGRRIYYVEPGPQQNRGQLMEVPVETGDTLVPGVPRTLFDIGTYYAQRNGQRFYDVAPDGRFVMIKRGGNQLSSDEGPARSISVVLNFFEQLKSSK